MTILDGLATLNVVESSASPMRRLISQMVFATLCSLVMIVLRMIVEVAAPAAGPFALIYPTVLIATLYGHWQAGLFAYLISFGWAWYYVLPVQGSFDFAGHEDNLLVLINAGSALVVLLFAEVFRRAIRRALDQRETEIARRQLLSEELEHRTKNNFAIVASILSLQKRASPSAEVRSALDDAIHRMEVFSGAFENLTRAEGDENPVRMDAYLEDIVSSIARGAFEEGVQVTTEIAPMLLRPTEAVPIGLFVNEAMTNCAKYAFANTKPGRIDVIFRGSPQSWTVEVRDDGCGNRATARNVSNSGTGTKIMAAIASQSGARFDIALTDTGCLATLIKETGHGRDMAA